MAKKRKSSRKTGRGKSGGRPVWLSILRLTVTTPGRQIILVAAIVALLFWQRWAIFGFWENLVSLFGWGLLFLAAGLVTPVFIIWRQRYGFFFRNLHRFLGTACLMLAVWGLLGFFGLGGSFGRGISGSPADAVMGILNILGLGLIGLVLIFPRGTLRALKGFGSWLAEQFRRQPAPKPRPTGQGLSARERLLANRPGTRDKPAMPAEMAVTAMPPEDATSRVSTMAPHRQVGKTETPPAPQTLRQAAEDVWKKYGQASGLVEVDGWKLPPLEILDRTPEMEFSEADNLERARLIEEALASYGVDTKVVQINAGPTVTQFGLEPGWDRKVREVKERDRDGNITVRQEEVSKSRVKVERITSLSNDLSLALAAPSIRIEAPVPGKSIVGIEVPNTTTGMVGIRGVVETGGFQKLEARSTLTLALGKGAGGEAVAGDLAKMPHLLIAGATGSGKTVCLQTIICCLLLHNTPNDCRFIMVDPKRVELTPYNSIPHLAVPVIVDAKKALSALRFLSTEMDKRYQQMAAGSARNIEGYNKTRHGEERMPYLVLIIDELADLMMVGSDEVETILCRLAQLSRAVGIHLVVATQRPSVDVVTGLIKANFPTRISFAVTSQVDSRTILDGAGAEKLLGRGDMLYMPTEAAKPKRLQGTFVSDAEIERLVYFWASQKPEERQQDQLRIDEVISAPARAGADDYPRDPLLDAAKELAAKHEHVSTSFLQRKLHIGYPRAARLMEQLEEELGKMSEDGEEAEE